MYFKTLILNKATRATNPFFHTALIESYMITDDTYSLLIKK